jgi:signal transduction histidine kinase
MFILNGKKASAKVYALTSFASNLWYYHHWPDSYEQLIASTLISAMLSGSIWYFSDLFVERLSGKASPPTAAPDLAVELDSDVWVCTLTDIHDQKSQRQAIEKANKELTRTNTDPNNFIYTASHDLKAYIANLEGIAKQLSQRMAAKADEIEKTLLDYLNHSTNQLKRTISDLTQIASVQKEDAEDSEQEEVFFDELLQEVEAHIAPQLQEAGGQISTDFAVARMRYRRKDLRNILYNLLSNAVKYRSPERQLQIHLQTRLEEAGICLNISDNGLGMTESQRAKLFGIFKRFHSQVEGSGIGLYIIKRILENNGGSIFV